MDLTYCEFLIFHADSLLPVTKNFRGLYFTDAKKKLWKKYIFKQGLLTHVLA